VSTKDAAYHARFVIAASGVYDIFPPIENVRQFLGSGFYTCVDCDGYKTTNKKLVVIGNSRQGCNLALAMKRMFTQDITFIPYQFNPPQFLLETLQDEGIRVITEQPIRIIGTDSIKALECAGGNRIPCETIMSQFGYTLNDEYLKKLDLQKDDAQLHYVTNGVYESSLDGLYIVGPLNTGPDQVAVAAGEGAIAAMDINKRFLRDVLRNNDSHHKH